ncbi:MAG: OmpH family outer membrane protein [Ignavibacteriaceae bacterium]|jgi:outer membrane protein|nr:OmpH family outer membrane protein [Ignavibacteriaceae bacterium]
MKSTFISFLISFSILSSFSFAQLKIGYVDSDTIMDNSPDMQDARQKIDALIQEWQTELRRMENELKAKQDDYEKRKLIMTEQTSSEALAEIAKIQKEIGDYRDKKFGANGELFQKQNELMKPIQNKVFTIIQQIATEEELDFVFDRSGDIVFLFAKPDYDLTSKVIERLKLE